MNPTRYQAVVQDRVSKGESLLIIAPTGLGKTFAVTGDLAGRPAKTIYAVPLRALGGSIRDEIAVIGQARGLHPVIHHGEEHGSELLGEEVVVTTYDQVVCGVPGLPLSFSLKAGHAIAGALMMSRLVLDEAHLAWGISPRALAILLGIVRFRQRLRLQTVIMTATMPKAVGEAIANELGLSLLVAGDDPIREDESLQLRARNRRVRIEPVAVPKGKDLDAWWRPMAECPSKRISFSNTVDRLQSGYDALIGLGVDDALITVLHNRMPSRMRAVAESEARERFGKRPTNERPWVLLTNQVAEAGLDISAPAVFSDPAPVDTLVQRLGRTARWFRDGPIDGLFRVTTAPESAVMELTPPYRYPLVEAAIRDLPTVSLDWDAEREWVGSAWGTGPTKAIEAVEEALQDSDFALNLFDRASQQRSPGQIASVFREILSVDLAVIDAPPSEVGARLQRDWLPRLRDERPDGSSVSLGLARKLLSDAGKNGVALHVLRQAEGESQCERARLLSPGDLLILPSCAAYIHPRKGLCIGDASDDPLGVRESGWRPTVSAAFEFTEGAGRQTLFQHTIEVVEKALARIEQDGCYRAALKQILAVLEPDLDQDQLLGVVARLVALGAALHDIGKSDYRWQERIRGIDPECERQFGAALIGRSSVRGGRICLPHTPPAYLGILGCAGVVMQVSRNGETLVRAIALAAARHHSSLLNPAAMHDYEFRPHLGAEAFCADVLEHLGIPPGAAQAAATVAIENARKRPSLVEIPLMLPNNDLFPLYAIVGRALLVADRESAARKDLERWRAEPNEPG